jgi:tetratricopeptide (TPR) repeat protein
MITEESFISFESFAFPSNEAMIKILNDKSIHINSYTNYNYVPLLELKCYYFFKCVVNNKFRKEYINKYPKEIHKYIYIYYRKIMDNDTFDKAVELNSNAGHYNKACALYKKNNYKDALLFFHKAFNLNYYVAAYDIAEMYYLGQGINKDINIAIEYYAKHLMYVQNEVILNDERNIPTDILIKVVDRMRYEIHKQYLKIDDKLKAVMSINGLRDIILQYL